MFTTCPKCSLKLVVTAADLRVAQGYVRCGRCSNVFNALAGLSDEQQAVLAREQAAAAAEQPTGAASVRGEEPIPDRALEFDASSTDVSQVFVESGDDDATGTFESIVLRSEDAPADDPELHELELDLEALVSAGAGKTPSGAAPGSTAASQNTIAAGSAAPPENSTASETAAAGADAAARPGGAPAADTASRGGTAAVADAPTHTGRAMHDDASAVHDAAAHGVTAHNATAPESAPVRAGSASAAILAPLASDDLTGDDADGGAHAGASPFRKRLLRVGSAALTLILALQIAHHERAKLADIDWLRPPLTAVYAALGMPLVPHWDVGAYEVRQLGAVAGPRNPGALTVRASVKNTGRRTQPLPLLRVTMQDRFGNRVAARDVPPSAYLPAASASHTGLASGQRVDAEIAFVDPGPDAVGFEIDACLKLASGRIACANDASARR